MTMMNSMSTNVQDPNQKEQKTLSDGETVDDERHQLLTRSPTTDIHGNEEPRSDALNATSIVESVTTTITGKYPNLASSHSKLEASCHEGCATRETPYHVTTATSPQAYCAIPTPQRSPRLCGEDCDSALASPEGSSPSSISVDRNFSPSLDMYNVASLTHKSSRSLGSHALVDLSNQVSRNLHVSLSPSSSPKACQDTEKALRRKHHVNVLRGSAPLPSVTQAPLLEDSSPSPRPQRPRSHPPPPRESLPSPNPTSCSVPITIFQAHSRSYSQPNYPRLGHPSRPYYSAIRKEMAIPLPPQEEIPPYKFGGPREDAPSSITSRNSIQPMSAVDREPEPVTTARVRHRSAPALSQMEQMELRLTFSGGAQEESRFCNIYEGRTSPKRTDTFKRKVQRLRQGIKDIWKRRT